MSTNAISKGKTVPQFIPEIFSQKLTKNLDDFGVMMSCVNKDYEGEIKAKGDTVHLPALGNIETSTYTGSLTYDTLDGSSQTLIIDQEKVFAFKIPDIEKKQSGIDLNKYVDRAKTAVDLERDTFLLGKHADVPSANVIGTETTPIALTKENIYGYVSKLRKALGNSNALKTGKKPFLIVNYDVESILNQCPEFTRSTAVGDNTVKNGYIGQILGFDVKVCSNLEEVGGKLYIMAGTTDAITFASQLVNIEKDRDKDSFADLVRGLFLYGAKTANPGCLAKLIATV